MNNSRPVALITGAARGLGLAVARALVKQAESNPGQEGIALFLVDILADRLEEVRATFVAEGVPCEVLAVDLSSREACLGAVETAVDTFGRLDILCNVAAIVRFNHATDVTEEEWGRILAVNLSAPFWMCQGAIPHLLKTHGNIVNVGSQSALMGTAYIVPYAASKGALVQMTRSLAMEYINQPIRINVVSPGTMATDIGEGVSMPEDLDLTLMGRYSGIREPSQAEDVAALVAFVTSPAAKAIHGAVLCADGGVTAG